MTPTPWTERIRRHYLANASNQFVLHGNVSDRFLLAGRDGSREVGSLTERLMSDLLARFDLVVSYELGRGLQVLAGEALLDQIGPKGERPSDPAQAIGWLDHLLRVCVNLRGIAPKQAAGRNHHVAVIIGGADLIFPMARQVRDYALSSMAAVVRAWSQESHYLEQNLAVFLLTENLADLHGLLTQNPRATLVEVPLPGVAELEPLIETMAARHPAVLANFADRLDFPAARLAGATLASAESLLKLREHEGVALTEADLGELKKSLVEKDAGGLIEFLEPTRTLDDVSGHEAVKQWMRDDLALWRQEDLAAMPMGYLLCGPVGTGKTYFVECLAGEADVPVVKLKNFRDRWIGSTEGNLEKIFALLHALGRCIVFIDEADQALGSRDAGSGDSGVSGRVYSMMAKEMSDGRNRGRILWILASSRPDLIEVDLKRPGRVDVKFPLFPAESAEETYALIRAVAKKQKLDLPRECPAVIVPLLPELVTPGAAESIAIKVYRRVRTAGGKVEAVEALRDCLDEYQNPVPPDVMESQIRLAVREASDLAFVPETWRALR